MIIALIAVIVIIVLLLIVLGLRSLGASSGADDYDEYDDYDETVEDEVAERPRRSARHTPRGRVDDVAELDEDPVADEEEEPRSRRRSRGSSESRASRKSRSRKKRDDWDDEDADYFSSLYADSDDESDDDPFRTARRDTRHESTQAMDVVFDDDDDLDEERPSARDHRSPEPEDVPAAPAQGNDSLAVLASLGQESAPSALAPNGEPDAAQRPADPPAAASRVDDDPLSAPRPSAYDTGSHHRTSYEVAGAPTASARPDDDPLSAPRSSAYDTGSHRRDSSYDDPLSSPSFSTGSRSRSGLVVRRPRSTAVHTSGRYDTPLPGAPSERSAAPDPLTDPSFTPTSASSDMVLRSGRAWTRFLPADVSGAAQSAAFRWAAAAGRPGGAPLLSRLIDPCHPRRLRVHPLTRPPGSFSSYDTGTSPAPTNTPPASTGDTGYGAPLFPASGGPAAEPPSPAADPWERPSWGQSPTGGQPPLGDPAGAPPAFPPHRPLPAAPGGYGSTLPAHPGPFSSYDTRTQPRTDYNTPPSAPSGTPYQSYDVLGDYPQSPPSPGVRRTGV